MKFSSVVIAILPVVFVCSSYCLVPAALGDTIVLQQGHKLTGDILAEKESLIYVDIGVTVLAIPKESILEYEYTKSSELEPDVEAGDIDVNDLAAALLSSRSEGQLYYTANRPISTIEKCVDTFSEAVVKVWSPAGLGSGFFINEDGYLITNYHVIEKETKIEITVFRKAEDGFEKEKFKRVKIEAINPFVDLALLKVEDAGDVPFEYVYLGDTARVKVGEEVFAIGNPLGLERTVTDGVVSTKNRAFAGLVYIQTNADINPGNSGGPLFNLAGEVVGVTNMGYIFLGGLGFAIPVDYVKHFIENRDAFTYDEDNPNTGFKYIQPDRRRNKKKPAFLESRDQAKVNSES